MPSLHKKLRSKLKVPNIYGASDQKVTRFFIFNRAWIANERIVGLTALLVVGLGIIGYATFALSLNSPAGYIDSPAPGQGISGVGTYISGWAVAASPIDHVDIIVNGVPARASYGTGGARPDVCAQYPQSPNCANAQVGWQYYFNSTAMPNGSYTLCAVFYGSSGGVGSYPSNCVNSPQNSQHFEVSNTNPFGYIDSPAPGAVVGNNVNPATTVINVGGWALDNETPISSVVMSVEGYTRVYYPTYGADRPDVCAPNAYPGRPGCNAVGFNYPFDTSNVSNGPHVLHIGIYDSDGIQRSADMAVAFTVSNNSTPPTPTGGTGGTPGGGSTTPGGGPTGGPTVGGNGLLDGSVDDPKPAGQSPPNPYSGHYMTIDGWAIGLKTVVSTVKVYVDGTYIGVNARYGQGGARTDVCTTHAGWLNCPGGNVGWQVNYDTTKLANGTHTVYAVISDGAFPAHDFNTAKVTFSTKNATPPPPPATGLPPVSPPPGTTPPPPGGSTNLPPDILIDNINDPGTTATTANGWAIDNMTRAETGIKSMVAVVDTTLIGNAIYGTSRPDVCAANKYPGRTGCPNVGWTITFDTSALALGTHTLRITATDSSGLSRTVEQTFLIASGGSAAGGAGGAPRATADRNPNTTNTFHVIYAVPAGSPDRHLDTNGAIENSINAMQSWLEGQSYNGGKRGKFFKIDTYRGTKTDTTYVPLPSSVTKGGPLTIRNAVANALKESKDSSGTYVLNKNKRYLIYFEGGSTYCAEALVYGTGSASYQNTALMDLQGRQPAFDYVSNGKTIHVPSISCTSVDVFNRGSATLDQAQWTDKATAHELMHTLGAVTASTNCAHYTPGFDGGHVSDVNDLMNQVGTAGNNVRLDIGRDSYWGANVKAPCVNVANSPFVN